MYATYVATLADGREVTLDTQYGAVLPHGGHVPTIKSGQSWGVGDVGCPQLTQMGGRCTCSANADIMAMGPALLAEAATIGCAEVEEREVAKTAARRAAILADNALHPDTPPGAGWCDRCESYCYGDCTASSHSHSH
jgi:hypothetical protein